jgi:protocatechuate 3,4-dioxygenase beta subunit
MKAFRIARALVPTSAIITTLPVVLRTGFPEPRGWRISRGGLIRLGGLGLAALVTGTWRTLSSVRAAPARATCILAPEQTQGPYYIAREKVRKDIRQGRQGTLLRLRLTVVDATTCKPLKGAAADVWHCDAGGIYSGYESASQGGAPGGGAGPTDKDTFLRGIQLTNARGQAEFLTIYPGWYRGRTVHIHVKVHLGGANGHVVHTGQLYFPESVTGKVYRTAAYKQRAAARDTFNSTDSIYRDGGAQSLLHLQQDGKGGYIGTITLGVRR